MLIKRVTQISESHCGPAVLEMLLDAQGVQCTQAQITIAARAEDTIAEDGVSVSQLGLACTELAPQLQFWYKYRATLDDIRFLLSAGYAVGVEWQGLFYDSEEEEEEEEDDGDFGHYSIVSHLDDELDELIIVDPYKDFTRQDRIIDIDFFLRRWWDNNEIRDPYTGHYRTVIDEQLLFFVTPKSVFFPREKGFKPFAMVE